MSILQADAINSSAAEEADWLHSLIDIPGPLLATTPHEESTHKVHFSDPHTLADSTSNEDNYKYYEPRVVSIGPFYYGHPRVASMEKIKRKAVRELLSRTLKENCSDELASLEQVYKSVEQDLLSTRDCYEIDDNIFSESEWCRMMFRDGCFIIDFITNDNRFTSDWRSSYNIMKKHDRDLIWRDLLLFQNQLPFQFLDVLACAFKCQGFTLHFLTEKFLKMLLVNNISSTGTPRNFKFFNSICDHLQAHTPVHLLQYYRDLWICILFGDDVEEENNKEDDNIFVYPPFSVTELKKVGIRCSSYATYLSTGFHFKPSMLSAKLFLPQLTINEWTVTLFYNIVAYEYSCSLRKSSFSDEKDQISKLDGGSGGSGDRRPNRSFGILSYLSFMSMLINGEQDVKDLRAREVVQLNLEVGDDQVVNFFRDVTAHHDPNPQAFKDVKRQISTYLTSKNLLPLRVGYAEFKQRYFSGPWSFLVFLAVIFTVSMTVIQTVLTGIQTYK